MNENNPEHPPAKDSRPPGELMPGFTRRPVFLLWAWGLPIGILLACNLFLYSIHGPDLEEEAREGFRFLLGLNIANLSMVAIAFGFFQQNKKDIHPWIGLGILVIQVLHLWMGHSAMAGFTNWGNEWFAPTSGIWGYQYTFCMVPAFYGLLSFAGIHLPMNRPADVVCTLLAIILAPTFFFLTLTLLESGGDAHWFQGASRVLTVFLLVACGILMFLGVVRLALIILRGTKNMRVVHTFLKAAFTLIFPIGGLLLNRKIPFPVDFQIPDIYLFTIANGILLCLPSPQGKTAKRILFGLRCVCYPFSIYFFLVFLPFLPLAIVAVVAIGTGFLILSPIVLFIVHSGTLVQGFRDLFPKGGYRQKALTGGLILLLPAWYITQSYLDRQFLHEGIHHVLSPDLDETSSFSGSRSLTLRSIRRFGDYKSGRHLPYLSDFYAWFVFNNLTLPDEKMQRIYGAFHGEKWSRESHDSGRDFWSRRSGDRWNAPTPRKFDHKVQMSIPEVLHEQVDGLVRTRTVLKLNNTGQDQNEFVTTIRMPEGVFISGYWLHVGKERVPGRLFEAKTAMWVYKMIRDFERRDPGIVTYETPTDLKLRVFPFSSDPLSGDKIRTTEIEFLYPQGWKPRITIGDEVLDLGEPVEPPGIYLADTAAGAMAVVPPIVRETLPWVMRTPYLHFNVDRSRKSEGEAEETLEKIREEARKFSEVQDFTLSLANYDYQELIPQPALLQELKHHLNETQPEALPARGGLLKSLSEARALHRYRKNFLDSGETAKALRVPILQTVLHHEDFITQDLSMEELQARFTPDHPEQGISPVVLLRKGGIIRPLALEHGQGLAAHFQGAEANSPLEVYDPDTDAWTAVPSVVAFAPNSMYSNAAELLLRGTTAKLNPQERARQQRNIVVKSKKLGILSRLTTFIVVENHAQWKALELSEKKKLAQNPELEFMENPEPPLWLLAPLLLAIGWHFRRKAKMGRH